MESLPRSFLVSSFLYSCSVVSLPVNQTEPFYVPEPAGRGTVGLLVSCVTTFLLCIWTAMHPDVIPVTKTVPNLCYRLSWMLTAAVFPELVVSCAITQLLEANNLRKYWKNHWNKMDKMEDRDRGEWLGLSGAFFVVMGGYVLEKPPNMGGEKGGVVTTLCVPGFKNFLKNGHLGKMIEDGKIKHSHFDHDFIEDKGKAGHAAKAIVCLQVLWMVGQCIGRLLDELPVTLLEIHVVVQIVLTIIAYICWWKKPLDVAVPIQLPISELEDLYDIGGDEGDKPSPYRGVVREWKTHDTANHMYLLACYDIGLSLNDETQRWSAFLALIIGGVHSAAWNSHFPTNIERLLWRISSIGVAVNPILMSLLISGRDLEQYLFMASWELQEEKKLGIKQVWNELIKVTTELCGGIKLKIKGWPESLPTWSKYVLTGVCMLITFLYVTCILFLTVESFISIRSLPAGAYKTPRWTNFLPHL